MLWSHYADRHRGVVLEFSVTDNPHKCLKIDYTDERTLIDVNRLQREGFEYASPILKKMVQVKSKGWSYEDEYRLYEDLEPCDIGGGFYFRRFPKESLRRVIIGWRSDLEVSYVSRLLARSGLSGVPVTRACAQPHSYRIAYEGMDCSEESNILKLGDDD